MRTHLAIALALGLACQPPAAFANEKSSSSVNSLHASPPCGQVVRVVAYANASKHGAWLSDTIGSWKQGILLSVDRGRARGAEIESLKAYIFNPRKNLHGYFKAVFVGVIECGKKGRFSA